MTKLAAALRAVLFITFAFCLGGCFPLSRTGLEEEKDPHFLEGKKRLETRDYEGAIISFKRALQTNPDNSAAHFQLGFLYDEHTNDNAAAIYHFQRFLDLKPDSTMEDVVKQRIAGCTRELARSVALVVAPGDIQREMARMSQRNEELEAEVKRLRDTLEQQKLAAEREIAAAQRAAQERIAQQTPAPTPQTQAPSRTTEAVGAPSSTQAEPARESTPRTQTPVRIAETPLRTPFTSAATPSAGTTSSEGWVPTTITPPTTTTRNNNPPPTQRSSRVAHRIRKGETIASLSRRYGVEIRQIIAANPGIRPDHLQVGQVVYVPR